MTNGADVAATMVAPPPADAGRGEGEPTTLMPAWQPPPTAPPGPGTGRPAFDPTKGGHVANGITETLLTGDTAEKVKAAALAAVPGGTIQRVETDAEGSPYEAHMTKSDGSRVTVKVDKDFKVTSVENDGAGPGGPGRSGGARPTTST